MTMSGKVIVKFLKPIHEREVQGPNFSLFQGSGSVRKKVVYISNKDSVLFGGGLGEELSVEDMAERGEGKIDNNDQSVIRDRMSRLVRYRMLQVSHSMSQNSKEIKIFIFHASICEIALLFFFVTLTNSSPSYD